MTKQTETVARFMELNFPDLWHGCLHSEEEPTIKRHCSLCKARTKTDFLNAIKRRQWAMRQPPNLSEETLIACLRHQYALDVSSARFLPIGYDLNAFVYEAITAEQLSYFVKIRVGAVPPPSLLVPHTLIAAGIPNILAPLPTRTQTLWCTLDRYSVIVYPFIRGENAMVVGLSDSQWREFGTTLRAIHNGGFASLLQGQVPVETFSILSAQLVRQVAAQIQDIRFVSPAASHLAAFWADQAPLIQHLLLRAEVLGKQMQSKQIAYTLCHADIHAANILVSQEGRIYLVDWDGPLLAPRERDLLFVVGSPIARRVELREEALFFEGYGSMDVDNTALAYYRYERAIEDIGEIGKSVFLNTDLSEEEKADAARLCIGLFSPGDIVEAALEADQRQGESSVISVP